MAIVPGSNTHTVDDKSRRGCTTRRAMCSGFATATDVKKSTAVKEARNEAKRQKDLAIAEAARTIHCPTNGCTGSKVCRQRGGWYSQGNAGSVVNAKKVGGLWEAKGKVYTEKRLRCVCRPISTASRRKDVEKNFADIAEKDLFGF